MATMAIAVRRDGTTVTLLPRRGRVEMERDGFVDVMLAATSPPPEVVAEASRIVATCPDDPVTRDYMGTWKTDPEHAVADALDPWRSAAALVTDAVATWPRARCVTAWDPQDEPTLEPLADATGLALELLGSERQPSPETVEACLRLLRNGMSARDVRETAEAVVGASCETREGMASYLRLAARDGIAGRRADA